MIQSKGYTKSETFCSHTFKHSQQYCSRSVFGACLCLYSSLEFPPRFVNRLGSEAFLCEKHILIRVNACQSVTSARIHALINGCIFVRRLRSFHLHPLWVVRHGDFLRQGVGYDYFKECKVIHWGAEKLHFLFHLKVRQAFIFTAQCHWLLSLVQATKGKWVQGDKQEVYTQRACWWLPTCPLPLY